ncbi:hypothetical protein [Cellulomonas dongxiuzhuiae]|uniref:hypothetical protein n=1 Tax=Cellulomonas dongxiuzhuiae TaxID=2819979 RepID=UPI001AAE4C74|nr:hypothetical protein [Cellulomonas dongxiuzhuiae]MBO3089426.1 hypothetical protein [Cellulomonas dongxiuzhuiae]
MPQLDLSDALALITAFLVTYGLGVLGGPAVLRGYGDDHAAAMTDQVLREIGVVGGWGGATVALWALTGAVTAGLDGGASAGTTLGGIGSALMAGALVAAMGALVRADYSPEIRALVDAERWANERALRDRLARWSVPQDPTSPWRARLGARHRDLTLPVVAQAGCVSLLVGAVTATLSDHDPRDLAAFLLLGFVVAIIATSNVVMIFAFFTAIPRAPILGSLFAAVLLLSIVVDVAFAVLYRPYPDILTVWFAPQVILTARLALGALLRRSVPTVASGPGALVDRRWWVAATLTASQSAHLRTGPEAHHGDRGYM